MGCRRLVRPLAGTCSCRNRRSGLESHRPVATGLRFPGPKGKRNATSGRPVQASAKPPWHTRRTHPIYAAENQSRSAPTKEPKMEGPIVGCGLRRTLFDQAAGPTARSLLTQGKRLFGACSGPQGREQGERTDTRTVEVRGAVRPPAKVRAWNGEETSYQVKGRKKADASRTSDKQFYGGCECNWNASAS